MKRILRLAYYLGILGSLEGILFYLLLIIYNPAQDVIIVNIFWEVLPATLSIIALYKRKSFLMALAFIIALPIGLYTLGGNGYIVLLGSIPFLYLGSFIIMMLHKISDKL